MTFNQLLEYTWETFFLKTDTQNLLEKLFPDPSLKNQNWAYLWINSLIFYTVCCYCMLTGGISGRFGRWYTDSDHIELGCPK